MFAALVGCAASGSISSAEALRSELAIVAGYFEHGEQLPLPPDPCPGFELEDGRVVDCITLDRPVPLLLTFRITEVVYGELAARRVRFVTRESHGLRQFELGPEFQYLIMLVADGDGLLMPSHKMARIGITARGERAVPLETPWQSIAYLPCEAQEPRNLRFVGPNKWVRIKVEDWTSLGEWGAQQLAKAEAAGYIQVSGATAELRRGVRLTEIARRLKTLKPGREAMECVDSAPAVPDDHCHENAPSHRCNRQDDQRADIRAERLRR